MQFKLRSLFVVTAIIGVYCGLVFALPPVVSLVGLCILTTFLPPVIVGGIVYGRGAARAFWIGCAGSGFIPFLAATYIGFAIVVTVFDGSLNNGDDEARWYTFAIAFCHVLVALQGLIVVGVRWLHSPRAAEPASAPVNRYAVVHRRITLADALGADQVSDAEG